MRHTVTCPKCKLDLCTIEHQPKQQESFKCARFFICPNRVKEKYHCKECPFFSETNNLLVICPCGTEIEISLQCGFLRLSAGNNLTSQKIFLNTYNNSTGIKIKEIVFEKEYLKIFLELKENFSQVPLQIAD